MHNTTEAMQQAIALAYEAGDMAPRVVVKGRGLIAEQIIAQAQAHGVYAVSYTHLSWQWHIRWRKLRQ